MPSIDSYRELGSQYQLDIIKALLDELDHPEKELDIIHVAGTNGKGSTISYLAHSFIAAGIDLMTFTSPQVRQYLDRFSLNGRPVEQADFDQAEAIVLQAADRIAPQHERHATVFEMEVAISLVLARRLSVRLFIMETGLGGRSDATNAVDFPLATVFSSISLDHKAELGDNIASVSREKAGIIKEAVPVFSTVQVAEAEQVLRDQAAMMQAPFMILSADDVEILEDALESQSFFYDGHSYSIHMPGKQQILNATLAVMVLRNLPAPYRLSPEVIEEGLVRTSWYGSFELIARTPDIILDGAHNQDAAAVLGENLTQYRSKGKCFGILHIFKDKDAAGILQELSDIFDKIWLPRTEMARSLPPEELQSLCQRYLPHTDCVLAESVEAAARAAKEEAGAEDSIVVFGSLSHLETARKALIRIDEVVRND